MTGRLHQSPHAVPNPPLTEGLRRLPWLQALTNWKSAEDCVGQPTTRNLQDGRPSIPYSFADISRNSAEPTAGAEAECRCPSLAI